MRGVEIHGARGRTARAGLQATVTQECRRARGTATDFKVADAAARTFANQQVYVTVMLETKTAFENLDAIAGMEGIHALTLGPHDLAQDLALLGSPDHDRVLDEYRAKLATAARKHRKTTAMLVSSVAQARKLKEAGVLIIAYTNEVEVLHQSFHQIMSEIRVP